MTNALHPPKPRSKRYRTEYEVTNLPAVNTNGVYAQIRQEITDS